MTGDDLRLGLADVDVELQDAVEELGFVRTGALFVKRFPADAEHWEHASARFEFTAEQMVRQAAGLETGRLESTLALLRDRAGDIEWHLESEAGHIVVSGDARRLADALVDLLVEPLADGTFRAFDQARIDCVKRA